MNLWKCDDGTFDVIDAWGDVRYANVTAGALAEAYHQLQAEASARSRLANVIGYCAQEGNDGEPYDTINALATGEFDSQGGGA